MTRKLTSWNLFVKKVYQEGKAKAKAKNTNYDFKQALVDASKRKSEMGHTTSAHKKSKSYKKGGKSRSAMSGGKTRKRRRN
jgi:hypothetical protein